MAIGAILFIIWIIIVRRWFIMDPVPKKKPALKIYYNKQAAESFVNRLEQLGYFRYADAADIDLLKKDMVKNYAPDAELTGIWDDEKEAPKEYRYYSCDGEDVYEDGGILALLNNLKPTFDKLNFKCDVTDYFADWDSNKKWLNQGLTMNGTPYIIFKNFPRAGWAEAPKRIAEILNAELAKQNIKEKIYLISIDNDGRLIFLTEELYQYIYSVYQNPYWKPLELNEWATVMEVEPMIL
ncbi:hypothetical protein B0O44_104230 [Pedobacter nutrimenti]|uniref:Uncharacterized protein n=1 Tax=Pedobacter nutrimenti TaxID=1241337 RepID=A0A318UR67_9SPHI|nr:hypothetical protein B0O44_104230 [Pedobacter nutrimenti]